MNVLTQLKPDEWILVINTLVMGLLTYFVFRATQSSAKASKSMYKLSEDISKREEERNYALMELYIRDFTNEMSSKVMPQLYFQTVNVDPILMNQVFNYNKLSEENLARYFDSTNRNRILKAYESIDTYLFNNWKNAKGEFKVSVESNEFEKIKTQSKDLFLELQSILKEIQNQK